MMVTGRPFKSHDVFTQHTSRGERQSSPPGAFQSDTPDSFIRTAGYPPAFLSNRNVFQLPLFWKSNSKIQVLNKAINMVDWFLDCRHATYGFSMHPSPNVPFISYNDADCDKQENSSMVPHNIAISTGLEILTHYIRPFAFK